MNAKVLNDRIPLWMCQAEGCDRAFATFEGAEACCGPSEYEDDRRDA